MKIKVRLTAAFYEDALNGCPKDSLMVSWFKQNPIFDVESTPYWETSSVYEVLTPGCPNIYIDNKYFEKLQRTSLIGGE